MVAPDEDAQMVKNKVSAIEEKEILMPETMSTSYTFQQKSQMLGRMLSLSSLGLQLLSVYVHVHKLRLGDPLCRPHTCQHYSANKDPLVIHGLSCSCREGSHGCPEVINNIVQH